MRILFLSRGFAPSSGGEAGPIVFADGGVEEAGTGLLLRAAPARIFAGGSP